MSAAAAHAARGPSGDEANVFGEAAAAAGYSVAGEGLQEDEQLMLDGVMQPDGQDDERSRAIAEQLAQLHVSRKGWLSGFVGVLYAVWFCKALGLQGGAPARRYVALFGWHVLSIVLNILCSTASCTAGKHHKSFLLLLLLMLLLLRLMCCAGGVAATAAAESGAAAASD
jgi:hypothetical protein